jgi:hypothetical protein
VVVGERREDVGDAGAPTGREEPPARVDAAAHEHEAAARVQCRQYVEDALLGLVAERLGVADDEERRAPEQWGRAQVGERVGQALRVLVGPQRACGRGAPRRSQAAA